MKKLFLVFLFIFFIFLLGCAPKVEVAVREVLREKELPTEGPPEIKEVPVKVKELTFIPSKYASCLGLGEHNKEEKRINMIFIGVGYEKFEEVKRIVEALIDYDSSGNGFFSVRPIRVENKKV